MSRVGNRYYNTKVEPFLKTLTKEGVKGTAYQNLTELRQRVGDFFETTKNRT